MNSQKLTGLANATATGDAVHFGQLYSLMYSLGFRRTYSMSFWVGDMPEGSSVPSGDINDSQGIGVTGVVYLNDNTVARFIINYSGGVLKFNYRAQANVYTNRMSTLDNDGNN